jgi:ABC-type multidrug transport system ATPase subunit
VSGAVASVHELWKSYGSVPALRGISFDVPSGEVVGLLGPNGAGKSTAIGLLLGFLQPTSGRVALFGDGPENAEVRGKVGYVQESIVFPRHHNPRSLLGFHAALLGIAPAERKAHVDELLARVGLVSAARQRVDTLSKGLLQRLGLAVALLGSPSLLILDEPTSNLDPVGRRDLCETVRACRARGAAVLLASHVLSEIEETCSRVVILREGLIVTAGTMAELRGEGESKRTLKEVFFQAVGEKGDAAS